MKTAVLTFGGREKMASCTSAPTSWAVRCRTAARSCSRNRSPCCNRTGSRISAETACRGSAANPPRPSFARTFFAARASPSWTSRRFHRLPSSRWSFLGRWHAVHPAGLRNVAASHNFTCTHERNSPIPLLKGKSASHLGNAETDRQRTSICRIAGSTMAADWLKKDFKEITESLVQCIRNIRQMIMVSRGRGRMLKKAQSAAQTLRQTRRS